MERIGQQNGNREYGGVDGNFADEVAVAADAVCALDKCAGDEIPAEYRGQHKEPVWDIGVVEWDSQDVREDRPQHDCQKYWAGK